MKRSTPKMIVNTLKENQLSIKKKYGQNFLVDQNILDRIIQTADIKDNTVVIEVGPGLGSLTEGLLTKAKKVIAYEIDQDLVPILNSAFKDQAFLLISEDILKRNLNEDINRFTEAKDDIVVVANLPYYITTPILMKFLEETKRVRRMVLMMQHEVAQRITAHTSTKDYNALSIAVQYRAECK